MANRKDNEKLKIPKWFKLSSYDCLAALTTPLSWLLQFAIRIDLRIYWHEIATGYYGPMPDECDMDFREIYKILHHHPLLPVHKLVARYHNRIDFHTVSMVQRGLSPVRHLTSKDLVLIYASLTPEKRDLIRHVLDCIERDKPYPALKLQFADYCKDESHLSTSRNKKTPSEIQVFARYREDVIAELSRLKKHDSKVRVLNDVLSNNGWGNENSDFLNEPLFDHIPREFTNYFALDATTPYALARECFEALFHASFLKKQNGKQISSTLFNRWRKNGILPYIDLKLYSEVEAASRRNSKIAISDIDLAEKIYPPSKSSYDSKKVADTTRPVAEALMDSNSAEFRQLLSAICA